MKKDLKSILQKLEQIEENQMGQLQGGFVTVHGANQSSALGSNRTCEQINNCNGGNCVKGCGSS